MENYRQITTCRMAITIYLKVFVFCSLLILMLAGQSPAVHAQLPTRTLITGSISENILFTLKGNTRPEANAENDRGRVADQFPIEHMMLLLRQPSQQERALDNFIDNLTDNSSPEFHHWLTASELGIKYGPAEADIDSVTGWLQSRGFIVNTLYPNRLLIDFSGTAGQLHEAFHTEIHQLDVSGTRHIANMSDPQIPLALAPVVAGVVALNDFRGRSGASRAGARSGYTIPGFPAPGPGVPPPPYPPIWYALVPADIATIYDFNPLYMAGYSGQRQTLVMLEDSDVYSSTDWKDFRTTFGLAKKYPSGSFTQVHPNSVGDNCRDPGITPNGDDVEATLDAELASAAAPNASIVVASCANTTTNLGYFIALQNLLCRDNPPAIVSLSYYASELANGAAFNAYNKMLYQQAAAEGVSVFVITGDNGGADYDLPLGLVSVATHGISVNGFASTPYNVAVGATDFGDTYAGTNNRYWSSRNTPNYGSALSYVPEIPWNNSCASSLFASFLGFPTTYGLDGICNSSVATQYFSLTIAASGGGPSGCATGAPAIPGVISGTCAGYRKPKWQSLVGNPKDNVRDIPDVSLFGGNAWNHYYVICYSDPATNRYGISGAPCNRPPDTWTGVAGTSSAAPIVAAVQALANQMTGSRQGNPNPRYYALAAKEYGLRGNDSCDATLGNKVRDSCIFHDITLGDTDVVCTGHHNCYLPSDTYGALSKSDQAYQPAYAATRGWDFATGIGSMNVYNFVTAFAN